MPGANTNAFLQWRDVIGGFSALLERCDTGVSTLEIYDEGLLRRRDVMRGFLHWKDAIKGFYAGELR